MGMTSRDPRCVAVHDDLAALATGTLTGRDRSAVLEHLEGCPACAAELEELSVTVDALMELVPDATPPDGFADRTVALMRAEPSSTVRRSPRFARSGRRIVAVAAIVVALALGIGVGALVTSGGGGTGPVVRTAALESTSGAEGSVVLSSGQPGWLVMTVADSTAWGKVTCRVTLTDGSHRVVGRYPMSSGYDSWTARLPVTASTVRSVDLVEPGGSVIASAKLTT
jgi:Putative zinc-finger